MLYSGAQLKQEIMARLHALVIENKPEAERLQKDYETLLKLQSDNPASGVDDEVLRNFLLRVMEAVHWNAGTKTVSRAVRTAATKVVTTCVVISFLLWIAPYLTLWVDYNPGDHTISTYWTLFLIYVAVTSGLFGAFFSRLIAIQRLWGKMTLDEAFLQRELSYTLMRAGVGVSGALLVLFFLRTGLVSSTLFPGFDQLGLDFAFSIGDGPPMAFVIPTKGLAVLTTFCFVAGFSELLVPSMLASTEARLSQESQSSQKTVQNTQPFISRQPDA
jgi:hypothetical protein